MYNAYATFMVKEGLPSLCLLRRISVSGQDRNITQKTIHTVCDGSKQQFCLGESRYTPATRKNAESNLKDRDRYDGKVAGESETQRRHGSKKRSKVKTGIQVFLTVRTVRSSEP